VSVLEGDVSIEVLSEFGATSEYNLKLSIPISQKSSVEYVMPGRYELSSTLLNSCTFLGYIIFFSFIF